ncbi:MAG TPA: glycosyltransferase family 2 protein [Jatrophihabitans sp.]|nr:glycosyltransferase family 2 protein [Jatrophihabitans sp.]
MTVTQPERAARTGAQRSASVSVVAVTYSPGPALARFLDSLALASSEPVEVVLADNGSTDGAPEQAAERPGVRVLATGGNLGYGRAANLGVATTGTDWVVVSNPDVVWQPGALDELLAVAGRWPRAGAVGPLIRTEQGEVYPSARELPSLAQGIGHALLGTIWPGNRWTRRYRREQLPVERAAGWLSGSCLLLRRAAFDSVHGFDPRYFMYFEDVDLGERLAAAGWLNVYAPSAEIVHTGSHATDQNRRAMFVEHHRSAYRYLAGRYPGRRWAPVRLLLRAGLMARARLWPPLIGLTARLRGRGNEEEGA